MFYSEVLKKRNMDSKKIKTNNLIVLCEIGEDYKSFCDDLEKLIKSKLNKDLVSEVYHAIQGKRFIGSRKYKNFIEKHKHTIDIMNKYYCLSNLTVLSYDVRGNRIENLAEDYFYQYIQEHHEDIEIIKAVALKIKDLGFNEIIFEENLDFTGIEYKLDTSYECKFAFLENMEVNPTYLNCPIKYRSNGSCYCLTLKYNYYGSSKGLSNCDRNIELNSLIFDANRLPNELTTESTIGIIKELAEKKKADHEDIRDSVDLNITTSELVNCFERFKEVSERIDKIKDNQELINLLNQMQNILEQLESFGTDFEDQIIASHTEITKEIIKREKDLYLDRRHRSSIDCD